MCWAQIPLWTQPGLSLSLSPCFLSLKTKQPINFFPSIAVHPVISSLLLGLARTSFSAHFCPKTNPCPVLFLLHAGPRTSSVLSAAAPMPPASSFLQCFCSQSSAQFSAYAVCNSCEQCLHLQFWKVKTHGISLFQNGTHADMPSEPNMFTAGFILLTTVYWPKDSQLFQCSPCCYFCTILPITCC